MARTRPIASRDNLSARSRSTAARVVSTLRRRTTSSSRSLVSATRPVSSRNFSAPIVVRSVRPDRPDRPERPVRPVRPDERSASPVRIPTSYATNVEWTGTYTTRSAGISANRASSANRPSIHQYEDGTAPVGVCANTIVAVSGGRRLAIILALGRKKNKSFCFC